MCDCKDIKIGSYDNQIVIKVPKHIEIRANNLEGEIREEISIDKCLAEEIKYLWDIGVVTTGCCCGHNKQEGYIGVEDNYITIMKAMGYKVSFNKCRPLAEDSFIPKSVINAT